MSDIDSAPEYNSAAGLRSFLDKQGFSMKKRFGQNFMIDPSYRQRIARLCLDTLPPESPVWEVGPGLGAITTLLLEGGAKLCAFEIDFGFARILERLFSNRPNFTLLVGDVLKTWPGRLDIEKPSCICGNLPYSVGSVFIGSLLEAGGVADRMLFTLQKEVVSRMAASPGPGYSGFSVLCQSYYRVEHCFDIPAAAFYPAPEVLSAAVLLTRRTDIRPPNKPQVYAKLLRAAFAARRKTLANNLRSATALNLPGSEVVAAAAALAGFSLGDRAERLRADQFLAFASALGI